MLFYLTLLPLLLLSLSSAWRGGMFLWVSLCRSLRRTHVMECLLGGLWGHPGAPIRQIYPLRLSCRSGSASPLDPPGWLVIYSLLPRLLFAGSSAGWDPSVSPSAHGFGSGDRRLPPPSLPYLRVFFSVPTRSPSRSSWSSPMAWGKSIICSSSLPEIFFSWVVLNRWSPLQGNPHWFPSAESSDPGGLMSAQAPAKHEEGDLSDDGPAEWTPSKITFMRRMMNSDGTAVNDRRRIVVELQDQPESEEDKTHSDHIDNRHCHVSVAPTRVCSDCNTTKTPLWRSGPQGPKVARRSLRRVLPSSDALVSLMGSFLHGVVSL